MPGMPGKACFATTQLGRNRDNPAGLALIVYEAFTSRQNALRVTVELSDDFALVPQRAGSPVGDRA